ncbi:hypothetical protein [Albidovulum sp.]|uniref:hypothetical protein n=1 Tax=Albidovulum sp. TaxID=1872424 RepID=UPI0039B956FB
MDAHCAWFAVPFAKLPEPGSNDQRTALCRLREATIHGLLPHMGVSIARFRSCYSGFPSMAPTQAPASKRCELDREGPLQGIAHPSRDRIRHACRRAGPAHFQGTCLQYNQNRTQSQRALRQCALRHEPEMRRMKDWTNRASGYFEREIIQTYDLIAFFIHAYVLSMMFSALPAPLDRS